MAIKTITGFRRWDAMISYAILEQAPSIIAERTGISRPSVIHIARGAGFATHLERGIEAEQQVAAQILKASRRAALDALWKRKPHLLDRGPAPITSDRIRQQSIARTKKFRERQKA